MKPRRTRLGVVLVHFHTPALLARALDALEGDAASADLALDIVVVDNGSTGEEKVSLEGLREKRAIRLLDPGRNLGYAGGLNAGAALLPEADVLVLMNPDVLVERGCLAALLAKIEAGAAVAGPAFFWDEKDGFALPPTEKVSWLEELLRIAAARWGGLFALWARSRWRQNARRHFLAESAIESYDLSGALMMVRAEVYHRLGGFDEGYALYFEETDFMQRLRRAGLPACFEPGARAVHLYAQSTPRDGRAGELFAASRRRFRELHYGGFGARLLALAERGSPTAAEPVVPSLEAGGALNAGSDARWLEISPSRLGFPAAAARLAEGQKRREPILSAELLARMAPGAYWLRALTAEGGELAVFRLEVAADQTRSLSPMV